MQNKIGYIICTHSTLAQGLVQALEMIVGPQDNIDYLNFLNGDDVEDVKENLKQKAKRFIDEGREVCFLVDLYGATPFNCSLEISLELGSFVVTGVNLPLLLELSLSSSEDTKSKFDFLQKSLTNVKETMVVLDGDELLNSI